MEEIEVDDDLNSISSDDERSSGLSSVVGDEEEEREESDENDSDRPLYDIRQNAEHPYLNSPDSSRQPSTSRQGFEESEAGTHLHVPLFFLPSIVLPGQSVPLKGETDVNENVLEKAMEAKYPYIGILTANFRYGLDQEHNVGVLVQINTLTQHSDGFSLVGTARQRFRLCRPIEETEIETGTLQSALFYLNKIEVEVLKDELMLPFHYDPACSFNRFKGKTKINYLQSVFALDPWILNIYSTENAVKLLTKWLCLFFDVSKVERALERGLSMFSFWVASNIPIGFNEKLSILMENCVDRRLRTELQYISELSQLGCRCGSEKIKVDDLINLSSESMGNCYVNPHGYVHDMFTARTILNVSFSGHAQTEFSWFDGYSWTIMNCANCGIHIGWMFKSARLKPAKFYGINRSAIKPVRSVEEI